MSWIQENKFVAGLAGVTAVIVGGILYVGLSQGGAYDEKLEQYQEVKAQYAKLEQSKPYPSATNQSDRESGVEHYEEEIKEVRKLVSGYRPEKLEKVTPEQFKDIQVKMDTDLRALFVNVKTELPSDCLFGFEKYSTSAVKAGATAKLHYELKAMQWMFSRLAEVKPTVLSNISRAELPEESGRVAKVEPKPKRGKRRVKKVKKSAPLAAGRAYELMPVEITFTASESSLREFLMALVNSKEYYYAIRGLRLHSQRQSPPNQRDASFPVDLQVSGSDDLFGSLEGFGEDAGNDDAPAEAAETPSEKDKAAVVPDSPESSTKAGELILKQVLGSEKMNVHLCLDIVLIENKSGGVAEKGRSK